MLQRDFDPQSDPLEVRVLGRLAKILLPVPVVLLLVAFSELAQLPHGVLQRSPWPCASLLGVSIRDQLEALGPFVLALFGVGLAASGSAFAPRLARLLARVAMALGLIAAWRSYQLLVAYPHFEGYPPFIAAWTALGTYLAWTYAAHIRAKPRSVLHTCLAWIGVLGAAAAYVFNVTQYPGAYPSLHIALLSVTFLLLSASLGQLADALPRPWLLLGASTGVTLGVCLWSTLSPAAFALPYYRSTSLLGQAMVAGVAPTEPVCVRPQPLTDSRALAVFQELSGLPGLPANFDIARYNILLVMTDSLRFDATSLGGAPLNATPALARLAAGGAFSFERAYSPSSITIASIAALFSMTYPSHTRLAIGEPLWLGKLNASTTTVAEHLAAAGYGTFRVVHGIGRFDVFGLDQGFAYSHVEDTASFGEQGKRHADELIAGRAIEQLTLHTADANPFFGFVFFVGPHTPYVSHVGEVASPRERYAQEVTHTDAQLGRILDSLEQNALLERTVVIVAGDHGEEFQEHGGSFHGRTVYDESIHVPLLVRLPGVVGSAQPRATSLVHVFPWLFASDPGALGHAAREQMRVHLAPMLLATGGAAVSELIGLDRMKTTLVYEDAKVNYDYLSGRYEVYRFDRDPKETQDLLIQSAGAGTAAWVQRLDAYRVLRSCNRSFSLGAWKRIAKSVSRCAITMGPGH